MPVHVQAPACWEAPDDVVPTRFETGLLAAEDEPGVFLEMTVRSERLNNQVHMILPLAEARRLGDQLSAHLDAAESGRGNRLLGVRGRLMMDSDQSGDT